MKQILSALALAATVPLLLFAGVSRGVHLVKYGPKMSEFDLSHGRRIFANRCARCHSTTGTAATIGPNLAQLGHVARNRKPGMTAAAYILESILNPRAFKAPGSSGEMPANLVNSLDDDSIRSLVASLAALEGTIDEQEIRTLPIVRPTIPEQQESYSKDSILRGEVIYRGKGGCATCHPFYGGENRELAAPNLFFRGLKDRELIRRAIVTPHAEVPPRYQQTSVVRTDGTVLTGLLIEQSPTVLSLLLQENGIARLRLIDIAEIETGDDSRPLLSTSTVSSMPVGIDKLLSPEEFSDLLTFLLAAN